MGSGRASRNTRRSSRAPPTLTFLRSRDIPRVGSASGRAPQERARPGRAEVHFDRQEGEMVTYIMLGQFTDQGIRNVKETTKRAQAVREMAKKVGATVKDIYWTQGPYDIATIVQAPDEASAAAFFLSVGALGNVRTQSLRAFTADEMSGILGKMN